MYIAVLADDRIVSIEGENASLDTMRALANMRYGRPENISRIHTTESMFVAFSEGRELRIDHNDYGLPYVVRA